MILIFHPIFIFNIGEKTIHRYNVGKGKEGRENIAKLKKLLETMQGYRKDPETGIVSTLRSLKYHTFQFNCGDFQSQIEKFTINELGGTLHKVDETTIFVPGRTQVKKNSKPAWREFLDRIWNMLILFIMDYLIFVMTSAPWVSSKIGVGQEDDFSDRTEDELMFPLSKQPPKSRGSIRELGLIKFLLLNCSALYQSLTPKPVAFPRRHRVEQLYSPRLKDHTVTFKT